MSMCFLSRPYSKPDIYVIYKSSRQRGSFSFWKEPVCAFTCTHPPRVICNNLAAATQGTDGLGVPQCPRFSEVQHKHKVFQGGWEPEITLMWHLSQPKTNYCSCFIHNKCTPVYTTLPEIYLGDLSACQSQGQKRAFRCCVILAIWNCICVICICVWVLGILALSDQKRTSVHMVSNLYMSNKKI